MIAEVHAIPWSNVVMISVLAVCVAAIAIAYHVKDTKVRTARYYSQAQLKEEVHVDVPDS